MLGIWCQVFGATPVLAVFWLFAFTETFWVKTDMIQSTGKKVPNRMIMPGTKKKYYEHKKVLPKT